MKKVFKKDFLRNELDLPWSALEDIITDTTRWSILHTIVFEFDGKFYRANYSVGATECQDERPWEYEDEIECIEVAKKQVLVEQWMPVKDEEVAE